MADSKRIVAVIAALALISLLSSASVADAPTYFPTIAGIIAADPPLADGTLVELQCKPLLAIGNDPAYGSYFVLGEDATSDQLKVYYAAVVDPTGRVNTLTGQLRTEGTARVLCVNSGPGYGPQLYTGAVRIASRGTIAWAKTFPDGATPPVGLSEKTITLNIEELEPSDSYVYIQETDRLSGIRVVGALHPNWTWPGDIVSMPPTRLETRDNQRVLVMPPNTDFEWVDWVPAEPLAMDNRSVGGGPFNLVTPGATGGTGLNTVGLLVRTWGKVIEVGTDYARISDGSDGLGVKIDFTQGTNYPLYNQDLVIGDYVAVTGVASLELAGGSLLRVVKPRSDDDTWVRDVTPPEPGTASSPETTVLSPIHVTYTGADDTRSGLKQVELWYKKGAEGAWTNSGLSASGYYGSFDFTPNGHDTYSFDLVAEDNQGNRSAPPSGDGDCHTVYERDNDPPNPGVASSPATAITGPIRVDFSGASDSGTGLKKVELWYRKGGAGNWADTSLSSTAPSGYFNFNPQGDDTYYFDLVAEDNEGNRSAPPSGDGDCHTVYEYDDDPPNPGVASSPATASRSPIRVDFSGASDSGTGLKRVELWYRKGSAGIWADTCLSSTAPAGYFYFNPEADDTYYFDLVAEDNNGNRSAPPSGDGDCQTVYQTQSVPGRGFTQFDYQYAGGPRASTSIHDAIGAKVREITYTYGPEGELKAVAGDTQPVTYTYDSLYRIKTVADGKGQTTQFTYDNVGNLSVTQYPGNDFATQTYDANGNVRTRVDGKGQLATYTYDDEKDLLTDIEYQGLPAANVHFSYDAYGRCSSVTDGAGTTSYTYDDLNTVTSTTTTYTGLPARTITWSLLPDGSVGSITTPGGAFGYTYDAAGRLAGLTNPYNEAFSWSYQDNDRLATQTLMNSLGATVAAASYSYNQLGLLTNLTNRNGGGSILSEFGGTPGMTYDARGNLTAVTASIASAPELGGVTTYEYDSKNELSREQSSRSGGFDHSFVYDGAGNPTTFKGVVRGFNSNNQNSAYTYDLNGNPTGYKSVALAYDPNNRLSAYGSALTAGYKSDGMRAWKDAGSGRTYFLYAGALPVCELDASGNVTAGNTFSANGLVSRHAGSGSAFYTFDQQGNTAQVLDDDGTVVATSVYDAYGAKVSTQEALPYGFGGQFGYYTDPETGLLLLTHRYYDPTEGRFLTRDPIGYAGGTNLYGYVGSNPANAIDPLGFCTSKSTRDIFWEICFEQQQSGDIKWQALNILGFGAVDALDTMSTPEAPWYEKVGAGGKVLFNVASGSALKGLSKAAYAEKFASVKSGSKTIGYWMGQKRIWEGAAWRASDLCRNAEAIGNLKDLNMSYQLYKVAQDTEQ